MTKKVWSAINVEKHIRETAKEVARRRKIPLSKLVEQLVVQAAREELNRP